MPYLINRIVIDHNLCEVISKLPYDEYYKVVIECILSNKYNDDNVEYIKGMLYKYPNLANIYGYQASDTKAFEIFHKLTISKDHIIVRRANNNLAHMYENGVGTKKDIEKAIEYYELSDVHSYAENLKLKMKKEQEEKENIRLRQALIEKYAHNKFDEFVKNYPKRSSEVINCYMKHALYKELEKEYNYSQKVIDNLEECEKLDQNNNNLIEFIKHILVMLKDFFRRILLSKNEVDKNKTINILKECYEKDLYNSYDLIDISKDTDKEIEVNELIKEEILEKEYDYFD